MKFEDVQKLYIVKDSVTFTPQTTCERKVDESGNVYGEYTIIKIAEEVYQEWLENKNKLPIPQPTADEILRAKILKDNASMQLQLTVQQKLNADILLKIASLGGTANV